MSKFISGNINRGIFYCFLAIFFVGMIASCSSSKQSTEKSSNFVANDYVKKEYKNILILVRVDPDIFRKRIEKALVKEFKDRKYNVSGSLDFVTPELMKDTLALRNKVLEKGFDAAIVVTYMGEMSSITEHQVYDGNPYNLFWGTFPVYDTDTKGIKTRYFQGDFYRLDGKGTQWRAGFSADLSGDPDFALMNMATKIRKTMESDNIL